MIKKKHASSTVLWWLTCSDEESPGSTKVSMWASKAPSPSLAMALLSLREGKKKWLLPIERERFSKAPLFWQCLSRRCFFLLRVSQEWVYSIHRVYSTNRSTLGLQYRSGLQHRSIHLGLIVLIRFIASIDPSQVYSIYRSVMGF